MTVRVMEKPVVYKPLTHQSVAVALPQVRDHSISMAATKPVTIAKPQSALANTAAGGGGQVLLAIGVVAIGMVLAVVADFVKNQYNKLIGKKA